MGSGEGREDFVGDKVDFFVVPFFAAGDSALFQIAPGGEDYGSDKDFSAGGRWD